MGALIGAIVGPAIGAIGSLIGGSKTQAGDQAAAQAALTGFNYLSKDPLIQQFQNSGSTNLNSFNSTQDTLAQLLGLAPATPGTTGAFQNYLNSTGYNFQLDQGMKAITGSAAAKGLLNSGDTAKALTTFGQNLAATNFNNYLNQVTGLRSGYQTGAGLGLDAAQIVGQAGSAGGSAAAQALAAGAQAQGTSIAQAANYFGGGLQTVLGGLGGGSTPSISPVPLATAIGSSGSPNFLAPYDFSGVSSYVPTGF